MSFFVRNLNSFTAYFAVHVFRPLDLCYSYAATDGVGAWVPGAYGIVWNNININLWQNRISGTITDVVWCIKKSFEVEGG